MKNLAFAIMGAFIMTAMASCEKEYTCTFTYPNGGIGTTETNFKTKKRDDAQAKCSELNKSAQTLQGSCALR